MAYVRKTDTLAHDIKRRVREMRQTAVEAHSSDTLEIGTPLHNAFRTSVDSAAWAAAPELKGKLPANWLVTPSGNRVYARVKTLSGDVISLHVEASQSNPWKLPPDQDEGYRYRYDITVEVRHQEQIVKDWINAESDRSEKRSKIEDDYRKVESQLEQFMNSHASLNSALKEMPALELYVPDEYMRRIKIKTPPREKAIQSTAVTDLGIDVDALTSAGIAHRIMKQTSA